MFNTKAAQIVETTIDKVKERRMPHDTNLSRMTMGSWKASLSRSGQAFPALKGGKKGQGALADNKKGKK